MLHRFIFIFLIVFFKQYAEAQSIPVTPFSFDEELRSLQLAGKLSFSHSLAIRPLYFSKKFTVDSLLINFNSKFESNPLRFKTFKYLGKFGKLTILPLDILNKINSHHPYGWNDGIMISASGYQTVFRAGVSSKLGPLSLQLAPEFIYANNPSYEKTNDFGSTQGVPYKRFYWGQSSISLNGGPISLGVSAENLWWGPGQYSSLLMSNNAPGFLHATVNSSHPLQTPIGKFEFQIISGRIEDEKNYDMPVDIFNLRSYKNIATPGTALLGDWKYLNGLIVAFQPKFLKNVQVGFSRQFSGMSKTVFDTSLNSSSFTAKYLPVLGKFFKSKLTHDDSRGWNQIAEIFFKFIFPESHSDLYFEYGWNDHSYNMRDFIMSPFHSASYTIGANKVVSLQGSKYIKFSLEANHMEQSPDYLVRWAGSWYEHYQGTGYSNMNQILGSGAGFGSNMQVFSISYHNGFNKLGLILERVQREPNTHVVRWNEMSVGIVGKRKIKQMILSSRLSPVFSQNYGWKQNAERVNFMGMLSASYYW